MNRKIRLMVLLVSFLVLIGTIYPSWAAPAAIVTVTSTADAGAGTLRQAIIDAQDGDTITFDPALDGMTVLLASPLPTITQTLTIDGSPTLNLHISGNNTVRSGLHINHPGADVTVSSLTFTMGNAGRGGAMYVEEGQLTLSNATISNNTAESGAGGGFYTDSGGIVILINSTVSSNIAESGAGGGFYTAVGGLVILTNSTVTNNTADSGDGGGFYTDEGGTVTLNSSIVSGNSAIFGDGQEILLNPGSFITTTLNSDGFNIVGYDGDSGVVVDEDGGSGIDNNLQPGETPSVPLAEILNPTLADNGGPTLTHALSPGSPAIDRVPSTLCSGPPVSGVDQRYVARNADGDNNSSANECDTGAFELGTPILYTDFLFLPIVLR